jgi:hypothetical protein
MSSCSTIPLNLINETEYIGDSLTKINSNFASLQQGACQVEQMIESTVNVRTFFYYGPNAPVNITEGANGYSNDDAASRPSDNTIQTFVNSESGLGLGTAPLSAASQTGDIVYVIYQKTGWYSGGADYVRSGSGSVPYTYSYTVTTSYPVYRKIGINWGKGKTVQSGYATQTSTYYDTKYASYSWSRNLSDQYNFYNPIYIIYKLVYNGSQYVATTDAYWPKYVKSQTNSIINWNDPSSWSTY